MSKDFLIDINSTFFERFFIRNPLNDKPLSGIELRLGFLLLKELNILEPKKLPQRKILANKLNVTQQAVIESLKNLEKIGFIERHETLNDVIMSNKEKKILLKNNIYNKDIKFIEKRRFASKFIINYFYNMTDEEIKNTKCLSYNSLLNNL